MPAGHFEQADPDDDAEIAGQRGEHEGFGDDHPHDRRRRRAERLAHPSSWVRSLTVMSRMLLTPSTPAKSVAMPTNQTKTRMPMKCS